MFIELLAIYVTLVTVDVCERHLSTGSHPAALKDEVTSPGGSTSAALRALEQGGLRGTLMAAVAAAADRCREMNK